MSSRRDNFKDKTSNPATAFLSWKSNDKVFEFFDKNKGEKGEKVKVPLPFKFLVLDELSTVKGWSDKHGSNIFSKEVKSMSSELNVRVFTDGKPTQIAKGLYKNIKDSIVAAGGKYHRSIYIMLESGKILNIQLKGSAVQAWGDFTQKTRKRLGDEWVVVADVVEGQKGSVKFTTPKFEFAGSLSDEEANKADAAYDTLQDYLSEYFNASEADPSDDFPTAEDEPDYPVGEEMQTVEDDDLPF